MILLQPLAVMVLYTLLMIVFAIGEIILRRRSREIVVPTNHDTGNRYWPVFAACQGIATLFLIFFRWANFGSLNIICIGLAVMIAGIALRWWSVIHLGRFFTVKLRVVSDQHVIDTGPYRYIRHPSYTGALLIGLGNGIALGNGLSLLIIVGPAAFYLLRRITTEESLLVSELGDSYRKYMQHTKRLLPGVY